MEKALSTNENLWKDLYSQWELRKLFRSSETIRNALELSKKLYRVSDPVRLCGKIYTPEMTQEGLIP